MEDLGRSEFKFIFKAMVSSALASKTTPHAMLSPAAKPLPFSPTTSLRWNSSSSTPSPSSSPGAVAIEEPKTPQNRGGSFLLAQRGKAASDRWDGNELESVYDLEPSHALSLSQTHFRVTRHLSHIVHAASVATELCFVHSTVSHSYRRTTSQEPVKVEEGTLSTFFTKSSTPTPDILALEKLVAAELTIFPCNPNTLEGQAPVPQPRTRPGCSGPNTFPTASFGSAYIFDGTPNDATCS
ncbi:3-ketoacyl-CoA synthase 12 [Senna tora]|uniref:3-ketoacyl-CoA synthase 12 n=1 Tax=Senna tora TaxID=362788 RepID=A0A834TNK9_9FABA|nr:3-ketoacyl-CoA synthase 12 [Senna tora]